MGEDSPALRIDEFMLALENMLELQQSDPKKVAILQALYKFVANV